MLIFKTGLFDAAKTFLMTDCELKSSQAILLVRLKDVSGLSHVPFSVIQKNFGVSGTDKFSSIPSKQLYIFPGDVSTLQLIVLQSHSLALDKAPVEPPVAPENPQGEIPDPFVYPWSQDPVQKFAGGSVRTVDSSTFKISTAFSAAEVILEPGAMRYVQLETSTVERLIGPAASCTGTRPPMSGASSCESVCG